MAKMMMMKSAMKAMKMKKSMKAMVMKKGELEFLRNKKVIM